MTKWLMISAAVVSAASIFVLIDLRRPAPHARPNRKPAAQVKQEEHHQKLPQPAPTTKIHPAASRLSSLTEHKQVSDAVHDPPTAEELEAAEEIDNHERNQQTFEQRLQLLESELAEGKAAPEQQSALEQRLRTILTNNTYVDSKIDTRCSDSVCEINFEGEGRAILFARSAGEMISKAASHNAHGSLDESAIARLGESQVIRPKDIPTPDTPNGEALTAEGNLGNVYQIRYLIDINDLNELPSPNPPAPVSTADPTQAADSVHVSDP